MICIGRRRLRPPAVAEGVSGSLDIEGKDGAWLTLELTDGRLAAVEVAVWPDVQSVETLTPPAPEGAARKGGWHHGAGQDHPGAKPRRSESPS